ncbi:MAG: V4R domain-containing protein [Conexivisphaera sp.]|jgi:predicted hydrocarbon binding protein
MAEERRDVVRLPLSWVYPGHRLAALRLEASSYRAVELVHDSVDAAGARMMESLCFQRNGLVGCMSILDLGEADPSKLEGKLRSLDGVRSIAMVEGSPRGFAAHQGLIVEAAGTRSLLMTSRALLGMLLGAREFLGEDVGKALLYYIGYYSGREAAREHVELLGPGAAPSVNFSILRSHGYASSLEVLRSPDGSRYRIDVRDLVECDLLKGHRSGRTSHWMRGMIAGILTGAEGGDWDVEEVECVNDGSGKCAFEARRRVQGGQSPPA